jgi:hypothetical protein
MAHSFRLKPRDSFSVGSYRVTLVEITTQRQVQVKIADGAVETVLKLSSGNRIELKPHVIVVLDKKTSKASQYATINVGAPPSVPVKSPQ